MLKESICCRTLSFLSILLLRISSSKVYAAIEDGLDFICREYNQVGELFKGLQQTQVIGKRITEIFPAVTELGFLGVLQQVWETGKPQDFAAHLYSDRRINVWLEVYVYRLPAGEVVAIYKDITKRMMAEEKIRKLAQAVEQSPESIVITNLAANIEYVNDSFIQKSGYMREEVMGKNPRFLQSGKTPAKTYKDLWNSLINNQPWKGELYNKCKDGTEYIEFALIIPIQQKMDLLVIMLL